MAQMKEQIKAPEKIQLSDEEIANLSDAELKIHSHVWLVERVVPHFHADKPGGTTGERDRPRNPGFQCRDINPPNL